jgi:hypothetical protein
MPSPHSIPKRGSIRGIDLPTGIFDDRIAARRLGELRCHPTILTIAVIPILIISARSARETPFNSQSDQAVYEEYFLDDSGRGTIEGL